MRIIAGRFRRRRLASAPGNTTRPLTDRVKERLFQLLGPFDGERILDVFAGTGTIGLEALSRGAAHAVFVERDHKAFELLCENVEALGVVEDTFCWRVDVLRCSFRPKGREELFPYDRIFFDPPYAIANQIKPGTPLFKSLERLGRDDVISASGEVVLRVPLRQDVILPDVWHRHELLEMGGMAIHRLRRQSPGDQDSESLGGGEAALWEEE
ncbi:MAG: 16S rRNA (guanine(966)-N(2))-methyltransferase RsmD [Planctomycetaceae bacterium]|nr:16S rRNA (guanine(966)-N(2))-methyltransferase RsmD [Planctomycetaceae bacterium]